jgi:hypothetical protein
VPITFFVVITKRWPTVQVHRLALCERARADFRALQVGQNRDGLAVTRGGATHVNRQPHFFFRRAVRKIQPRNVHAGVHQLVNHFLGGSSRSQGADDFGPTQIQHDYLVTAKALTTA